MKELDGDHNMKCVQLMLIENVGYTMTQRG